LPFGRIRPAKILVDVEDFSLRWFFQSDQVSEQRAFAATAATHDDENVPIVDREIEIPHENEAIEGHRQVAHRDMRLTIFTVCGWTGHLTH
jgi:hypothetical protein